MVYRRDGVVVRASASQSVDLGFNPFVETYQKTLKMVSTASVLGALHLGEDVENEPASSLDVSSGKALKRTPPAFLWKTGGRDTEMATPKRVWTSSPNYSDTIRFLINGG